MVFYCMDTFELLQRLSVALAIGLIIGLERGWQSREHPEGGRAAGLRTHALCALLGGVWGAIAQTKGVDGVLALGLAFSAFSAAIIVFRYRETAHEGTFGATTVVAAMLAFTLGSFAVVGDVQAAAAAGVAVAGLLSLKRVLHDWLIRLSWDELRSALVLLAMTCVLLPLLPNHTVDPWSAINPFELWLMTIMIAAISFVGYAAIKFAGIGAGAVIMGVAGGLTSSTAVTMTLSKLAGEHPGENRALGAGIVLSWATMMMRVLLIVAFVNFALVSKLVAPLGLAGAALTGIGLYLTRKKPAGRFPAKVELSNPFEFSTVLTFGALLTLVAVMTKVATAYAGNVGAYALAAISGFADVDAITLSMSRLGIGELGADVAARAILIVVTVNTFSKACLGWMTGGFGIGRNLFATAAAAIAAGLLGYFITAQW